VVRGSLRIADGLNRPVIELSRYVFETLRKDAEFILYRGQPEDDAAPVLLAAPVLEYPRPESLKLLEHAYSFKEELDRAWAARPIAITRHWNRAVLVMEDPGGVPLDQLLGRARNASALADAGRQPLDIELSLSLAISLSNGIGQLHQRGIVHKDIKPAHILVDCDSGQCWLRGFGVASRLKRERQAPEPPEFIEGTLAYMAPEQTGRMNRSIDSRSDLYSFGVTLYEMVTGSLPFTASDPMEWVHCHIAKQPIPPAERAEHIPEPVSAIIMKLLAKTAEERYQTAAGVEYDLRRCLALRKRQLGGCVVQSGEGTFPLGQHDTPDQLLIPEKLYGRTHEIDTLLASFERVVANGTPELVLVSGYSGIGKSSIVSELHKVLVLPGGLFASGKFDQYKRDIPYSTVAQAFQNLVRQLLSKSEAELRNWRDAFHEALSPNGQLMVDLVPELKLIIGEQPPVSELSPQDTQRRFQLVFRRFIGVFARKEHPLALFLDDLQWLDAATLDLLEDLLTHSDVQHLMLVGAYRDNEVNSFHPLMRKLEAIRQAGVSVREVILAPLALADVARLIADALRSEPERVSSLAQLVHGKTGGNPFFAIQFLSTLAEEALLVFNHGDGRWSWDLNQIQMKGFTDNVVDLMVGKLNRLPIETQNALQEFACLGNSADIATLSIVHGTSEQEVQSDLWEPVRMEFVVRLDGSYKFVHDRVQEAAYSLIPEELRAEAHLRLGRLLVAHTPPEKREEAIFEIVNQFNRGASLITSRGEREQLAELNLIAGKRAKASTAFSSALTYLTAGAELLSNDSWERQPELWFQLELRRAECEFLTGQSTAAEHRLTMLSSRARNTVELATVTCLRVDLYTTLDRTDRVVDVCLGYLRHLGVEWSPHPTEEEARREYERVWIKIGNLAIEELIDLPLMTDPTSLGTLDVLTRFLGPVAYTDANLVSLTACRAINLSLEKGNSDGSCVAYVWLGRIAGPHFGDYQAGFRFGQLGYELAAKRGLERFKAPTYLWFAQFVVPWTKHVRTCRELMTWAFEAATKVGDITVQSYCFDNLNTNFLAAGDPLAEAQRQAEEGLEFVERTRYGFAIDIISGQLGLIRTLRGLTRKFGCFDDGQLSELQLERHFAAEPAATQPACWYWIRKLQAYFFAGDYEAALDAAARAQRLLWTSPATFETAEYHFYSALSHAALCSSAFSDQQHLTALAAHRSQLENWAGNCPENFEDRAALVGAEIARIAERELAAERLYEKAIRASHANGFVHNEAIASELAARFYAARGFDTIADAYLRKARYCYLSWGAAGKVRQLDELYPQLGGGEPAPGPTSTIGTPVEHLDLATVIKVSQAVSGEIVLEKLINTLMRSAIEQAGAERGLLILPRGVEQWIEAEAATSGESIIVRLQKTSVAEAAMPESIINYVIRTQETVILNDASAQNPFSADTYLREQRARSILCLPLINQGKLIGVLYLENNLTPHVFTPTRITVLKLLASQAAISLENTRLYRDLEEREAKIRRLVDANIIGIVIWNLEGEIIEANDAFLHMVLHSREDLVSGRLRWRDLTPAEWRDRDEQAVVEVKATGTFRPFEKEYFRKDGSRVRVLLGAAMFEGSGNEGVAFVIDLSEQKRAEEALGRAQAELAHVTRVATLGELTASIAHEINQPLAAVVTNANASLRWLSRDSPDLAEACEAIRRIVRDGNRAGEVISRMRALFKKASTTKERFDINEAIEEVVVLAHSQVQRNRVSLQTQLATELPLILGDRIQLQQVILNLLMNSIQAMSEVDEGPRELWLSSQKVTVNSGPPERENLEDKASGGTASTKVLVAVRDSGPGLDPESLDRLFDAFHTTKPQGLGMGLTISRSIIEAHGGRLWATANVPQGAVFQFTLPVLDES
jgi:PAS domain S-box-containing protein